MTTTTQSGLRYAVKIARAFDWHSTNRSAKWATEEITKALQTALDAAEFAAEQVSLRAVPETERAEPAVPADVAGLINHLRKAAKCVYLAADDSVNNFARAICSEAADALTAQAARIEQEVAFSIELNERIGKDAERIAELEHDLADRGPRK